MNLIVVAALLFFVGFFCAVIAIKKGWIGGWYNAGLAVMPCSGSSGYLDEVDKDYIDRYRPENAGIKESFCIEAGGVLWRPPAIAVDGKASEILGISPVEATRESIIKVTA